MTAIEVPGRLPGFQEMESTPARALTVATNLRAVTVGVKDVQDWAQSIAAPEVEGETGAAHAQAASRFAVRLDGAEAALDTAVTAADRFEARLSRLEVRRRQIDEERRSVNTDTDTLVREVEAEVDDSRQAELERRAEQLRSRATAVTADIASWVRRYQDAEADFVAALAAVDSAGEGRDAAAASGRVDADPLTAALKSRLGDPVALAAWWAGLSRAQRQALSTEHPHLVGNAGGLPVRDRDEANRAALYSDVDYWAQRNADGQLMGEEKSADDNARHVRDAVDAYGDLVDPATGRELTYVVVYQPGVHSGDGAVAISFGDPDTADHVSVTVPGLTSETSSTLDNLKKTHALHEQAGLEGRGSVASVYWLDYDAPSGDPVNPLDPMGQVDFGSVALTGKADEGGERFGDFIGGLSAADQGERAHVTAIGHSYGSTTVGHALQDGMRVDDAILIGSPGQPKQTAAELTSADVWVGSKDYDPVSLLGAGERGGIGALGQDPAEDDFGGTRFATGDGSLAVQSLLDNHTTYFEGESLDNMAHIVTGHDGAVAEQPHRGADGGEYLTLQELLAASTGGTILDGAREAGEWLLNQSRRGAIL